MADIKLPHLYLVPQLRVTSLDVRLNVIIRKLESWAIVWLCLRDPKFCRFDTVPACDGRTDRRTDGCTHDDSAR